MYIELRTLLTADSQSEPHKKFYPFMASVPIGRDFLKGRTRKLILVDENDNLIDHHIEEVSFWDVNKLHPRWIHCYFNGYRVQIAVEDQYHLVTHFETDNKQDRQKGAEVAIAAKENMGKEELDALLDKGYHKGSELQEMEDNDITPYVSPPDLRYRKNRSGIDPAYDRSHFKYSADADEYTCPEGHILKTSGKEYKKADRLVKEYRNVKACVRCPVKDKCTARDQGRIYLINMIEKINRRFLVVKSLSQYLIH